MSADELKHNPYTLLGEKLKLGDESGRIFTEEETIFLFNKHMNNHELKVLHEVKLNDAKEDEGEGESMFGDDYTEPRI